MHELLWRHAARSDLGRVRATNEDALLANERGGFFVIADGMGGHAAGEVASGLAVSVLARRLAALRADASQSEVRERLRSALSEANRTIRERASESPRLAGMGTTATALVLLRPGAYVVGHVGDSRAYLRQRDDLVRITEDHTYVQDLVDRGILTPEQARLDPRSSLLTRALGIDASVEIALYQGRVEGGQRFLLCSDGLSGALPHDLLARLACDTAEPGETADRLVDAANRAGGADNISVIVVDVWAEATNGDSRRHGGDAASAQ
ncbi:MAG: Stp1/IreP family PP2C-type Ser/Thr phosphatase [Gemmatimonadota bacterium]